MTNPPPLVRKSSIPWDRLKPVKQDTLETMGFVSKGDSRLLDVRTQESYYNKIVARYMQFCTQHSKDLDNAFRSLSLDDTFSATADAAQNPPIANPAPNRGRPCTPSPRKRKSSSPPNSSSSSAIPPPSTELSTILLALRKLREALLATSSSVASPVFSQRVHVFNIRLAILALHPPSYYPPLLQLLFVLHTRSHPLPDSELTEFTTYLVLDLACRQNELASAFALRISSNLKFGYENRNVNVVLSAVVTSNWVAFWKVRRKVDGYVRAMMGWHVEKMRRCTLKTMGRTYLGCDVEWVVKSATDGELSWEELVEKDAVGWVKQSEKVIIRKPNVK